ncbi:mCG1028337, partial [Mus musculus]
LVNVMQGDRASLFAFWLAVLKLVLQGYSSPLIPFSLLCDICRLKEP